MKTIAYDHQIFSTQQFGGVSRYFCEIASRAPQLAGWDSVVVAPVHFNDHLARSKVRQCGYYLPKRVQRTGAIYRAVNAVVAPLVLKLTKPDLLHRTYYACVPRPHGARVVVTVFDLIHEISPQYFARDRTAALKGRAMAEADAVICISQSTAQDLQRLLKVPSNKITVAHLGYSPAFAHEGLSAGADRGATRPYFLYVGQRAGYKNFARLLTAYAASSRLMRDFDLVTFGGAPLNSEEMTHIGSIECRPDAVRRQVGSDEDLARAYAGAHALVYPSEYEGFGIPLLEAMSAGCPVICSNVSSIPEVAGDAAEYFDPIDTESIRSAIERVAYDDGHRDSLIERGHRRCRTFSWDRCAEETLAVYRRVLS